MDKLTALKALAEKVEAGTVRSDRRKAEWHDFDYEQKGYGYYINANAAAAYNGSLDAAKALHDALLPEWDCDICIRPGMMSDVAIFPPHATTECESYGFASHDNTARAWLLAILRALIEKGKGDE